MIQSVFVFMKQALRQDSRLITPSLMRLGILGITLYILATTYFTWAYQETSGLLLISRLTWWNIIIIGLFSIPYFSSVITEEKETQTIGLLRMTGIRPISLLLGKSIPKQLNAVLLLTLQFPFTLLAITLGGVTTNQVVAVYCMLLSFLIMVANICLFSSVVCRQSRGATWMSLFLILIVPLTVLVLMAVSWANSLNNTISIITSYLWEIVPIARLEEILRTGYSESVVGYQFYSNLTIGFIFFFLSWLTFNIFVKSDLPSAPLNRGLKLKSSQTPGKNNQKASRKSGRVWEQALVWKEFYFSAGGFKYFKWKMFLYPLISILVTSFFLLEGSVRRNELFEIFGTMLQVTMMVAFLLELAVSVSKLFRDEINSKTYTSLWLLPVSLKELSFYKIVGAILGLGPAFLYLCVGAIVCMNVGKDVLILEILEEAFNEPIVTLLFVSTYLLFLGLVLLFSLLVKRGAIPLAFVFMWFFYSAFVFIIMFLFLDMGSDGEGVAFLMTLCNFGGLGFLVYLSHLKLVSLAESE